MSSVSDQAPQGGQTVDVPPCLQQKEPTISMATNGGNSDHPNSAVGIEVPAGAWMFIRSARRTDLITAELVLRNGTSKEAASVYRTDSTLWGIEERLGFALPTDVQKTLQEMPVTPAARPAVSAPSSWIRTADYQPWRASIVVLPQLSGLTTYGSLLSLDPPIRVWENGPYRIDVVDSTLAFNNRENPALRVAYRIWHDERVIFAANTLPAPLGSDLQGDGTLRRIADHVLAGAKRRTLTASQREFLTHRSDELQSLLTPPAAPYPIGSRVKVRGLAGATPASGIITDTVVADDGSLRYGWRPDVARLPGHPMGRLLDRRLLAPAQHVQPTLSSPDAGLTGTQAPDILAYGAKVRTIDDPRFATGTVLRAILKPDSPPTYDVQPDGNSPDLVRIPAAAVEPLAGTAWPTVQALLDARTEAGIPLEHGELLITLREATFVTDGPTGPQPALPAQEWPSLDPILDPDSPDLPALPNYGIPPTTTPPRIVIEDDYVRVFDPRHELLIAPNQPFETALTYPREKLIELLIPAPDLHLGDDESLVTLAALAARHFPDEIIDASAARSGSTPETKDSIATDPDLSSPEHQAEEVPESPEPGLGM
ncbi:hypothetical protein [Parafrankia elaeagni]|uniref:hypothetical protein n=1 Tax=Parafrankia elaeagni TaxID=222534 RepID=UPI0012B56FA3|nr:hypothetical protein [Parafrankia elaeagni]